MSEVYLTPEHEWVRINANSATVGLACHALSSDIVYIELPAIGQTVEKGAVCAMVESVKAVCEVHAPVSGVIAAVNDAVYDDPDAVVKDKAWLFTVDFEGEPDMGAWQREQ